MQLPFYRRITEEDLSDAPKGSWKGKLLYSINLWMQQLYSGLNNGLTPEQNMLEQTKTFTFTGSATPANNTFSFATNFQYYPLGIDVININPTDGSSAIFTTAPHVSWSWSNGQLSILGICGLTTSVKYICTVRVWWAAVING